VICIFVTLTVAVAAVKAEPAEARTEVLPALTPVTVTFALVDPAETVTFGGTVATLVLVLARVIICPPAPAGADKFTVSEPDVVATTFSGFGASVITTFATLTVAVPSVKPGAVAVMLVLPAPVGVTVTFAVVEPGRIVAFRGTVATLVLLLARLMSWPPVPAGAVSVTVSEPDAFVTMFNGLGVRVIGGGGAATIVTVEGALFAMPSLTINCTT
jgi:hypothetical protein